MVFLSNPAFWNILTFETVDVFKIVQFENILKASRDFIQKHSRGHLCKKLDSKVPLDTGFVVKRRFVNKAEKIEVQSQ